MKRYVYSATESKPNIFKLDTDISYYNSFLNDEGLAYMEKAKNRTGKIVYMTPAQYYKECATKIFKDVTVANLKRQRSANSDIIKKYEEDMLAGDQFPLCYLNYTNGGQEGLHRMMAAGNVFGWDTEFPVLVVDVVDARVEELDKVWRYFNDAVYRANDCTYRENNWEQEFIEEVEWNIEHATEEHYDVIITSRRDKEECARTGMDYAIEIALAEFADIMHPITVFEPELKPAQESEDLATDDDDIDLTDDDIDWDLFTL